LSREWQSSTSLIQVGAPPPPPPLPPNALLLHTSRALRLSDQARRLVFVHLENQRSGRTDCMHN